MEDIAVTRFREYLRIKTVHPTPDYESAVRFLTDYGNEVGFEVETVEPLPGKPFVTLTMPGSDPTLPSLVLYSHIDVVPVYPEQWKFDPFGAHKDENGDIFARGTQDMKSVGIQYIEAIRRMKSKGVKCLRTIHVLFGADEETCGWTGMAIFVKHEKFKRLNIGFVLDEGLATEDDTYRVYYGERCTWWLKVTCSGNVGHASKFVDNIAAEKLHKITGKFLEEREKHRIKFEANKDLTLGDMITFNLVKIEGGVQLNVVPGELIAYFDIRVPPTVDMDKFTAEIESWAGECGPGITFEFIQHYKIQNMTDISDKNPFWKAFRCTFDEMKLKFKTEIFCGGTDSKFLRELGYESIGFSPMIKTPSLLHDHNEFLNEKTFLEGIDIYASLIPNLANVPAF